MTLHVEQDRSFRRTNATMAQVTDAFQRLVAALPSDHPAVVNAHRVVALLGHSLEKKP